MALKNKEREHMLEVHVENQMSFLTKHTHFELCWVELLG